MMLTTWGLTLLPLVAAAVALYMVYLRLNLIILCVPLEGTKSVAAGSGDVTHVSGPASGGGKRYRFREGLHVTLLRRCSVLENDMEGCSGEDGFHESAVCFIQYLCGCTGIEVAEIVSWTTEVAFGCRYQVYLQIGQVVVCYR